MSERRVTRLAPSPTGALHLGNAMTFLVNWALARQEGWKIVLRIEDLDTPRVRPGADRQAIKDLAWLGIDWDEGPFYQLADLSPYRQALETLYRKNLIYPCRCTRRDIEQAASAPQAGEHERRYPGTCRNVSGGPASVELNGQSQEWAWRLKVPEGLHEVRDLRLGDRSVDIQGEVGDFVVATKAGLPAYQLAVVVDDARQGVTDVIRGEDLLPSAARQNLLYDRLDLGPPPLYRHLPLVLGADGRRLAKRHGDTRIAAYREKGIPPGRILALLARWCGAKSVNEEVSAADFLTGFDPQRLPAEAVVMQPEDDRLLTTP